MKRSRGFTLIELITVIAITTILMTIIFVPVIQGFNLTRAAQAFADAQDRARSVIRLIDTEVGNAAAVRDNNGDLGAIVVVVPGATAGSWEPVKLPYCKLDMLLPAEGDPRPGPSGAFYNPDTGMEDPTQQAPRGQVNFPAAGGLSMVRYFVGLRQPVVNDSAGNLTVGMYNNPYDGLLMQMSSRQDNLYVLYRAQVRVKVWDKAQGKYVVNANPDTGGVFVDANNDGEPDDIDDPAFFSLIPGVDANYATGALTAAGQAKARRILNWQRHAQIVTEVSRYDMILPVFDLASRKVQYYNNGNVPVIVPLVRFQPTRVTSEPAAGARAVRSGEESMNMAKVGPDLYKTQYGLWSDLVIRAWPSAWPTNFAENGARAGDVRVRWDQAGGTGIYMVGRTVSAASPNFGLFAFDPATQTNDMTEGYGVFDVARYVQIKRTPRPDVNASGYLYPYAFSEALTSGGFWSSILQDPGISTNFVPFVPDTRNGQVVSSFDCREVGVDQTVPFEYRVPTAGQQTASGLPWALRTGVRVSPYDGGTSLDYTPNNDPDVGSGTWTDPVFQPINRRFNKLWVDFPTLVPGLDRAQYVKRFIDLRVCPQPDGTKSMLDPTNGIARAYITPGSDTVIGPDQRPGPNFGHYVRYTRVTQRPVGANQYYINYVDQPEPDYSKLGINFQGVVGNPYNPLDYSAASLLQAVVQPQYRAGYIELNSRFGEPIPSGYSDQGGYHPTGNIFVSYRFQFTEPNDVIAVDYDSTQVVETTLSIRNFPLTQNMPNPQSITVKGAAEVRNFVR